MKPGNGKLAMKRMEYTKQFIKKFLKLNTNIVLDIGENNPVGNKLANYFGLKLYNTSGDLDYSYEAEGHVYDVVFCFEVLEHLLSPKFFLMELKKYIDKETQIFISYPSRCKPMWTPLHFHEYDKARMKYLLEMTGYKIINWEKHKIPRSFFSFHTFKGIRPFIRYFYNPDNLIYMKIK